MTPSHQESLLHLNSTQVMSRHTTFTRRRQRMASHTQGALKNFPADQEGIESSLDGDSLHWGVKFSASHQEDISHPVFTKEGSKYFLLAKMERNLPLVPTGSPWLWFISYGDSSLNHFQKGGQHHSLLVKEITEVPYVNLIPSHSCQGRDPALQYECGYPLYDPSVLGGHIYTHFVRSNLKRIPLQRGRCSSTLSPKGAISPSQSDQCGFRLSSSHQGDIGYVSHLSGSLRMFQAE